MEAMERIWQSLFKRKKKRKGSETPQNDKENIVNNPEPERVTVKTSGTVLKKYLDNILTIFSYVFYQLLVTVKHFPVSNLTKTQYTRVLDSIVSREIRWQSPQLHCGDMDLTILTTSPDG